MTEEDLRFQRLVESAPDMLYHVRLQPELVFLYVNPAAVDLTGHGPEAFYANPTLLCDLSHPDDRERLAWALRHADRPSAPVEVRLIKPSGELVWTEHRIVPVLDSSGVPVGALGTARDISERRRAEEEVRLLQATTLAASESQDVPSALAVVLREVCRATGWAFGQSWLPSEDGEALLCGPSWSADRERSSPSASIASSSAPSVGLGS